MNTADVNWMLALFWVACLIGGVAYMISRRRTRQWWLGLVIIAAGCLALAPEWQPLCVMLAPGCYGLAGTYRGENSVFVLRGDGTFQQRYTLPHGTLSNTGRWWIDSDVYVGFSSILLPDDSHPDGLPVKINAEGNYGVTDQQCIIYGYTDDFGGMERTSRATGRLRGVPEPNSHPEPAAL